MCVDKKYGISLRMRVVFAAMLVFFGIDVWSIAPGGVKLSPKVEQLKADLASAATPAEKKNVMGKIAVTREQEAQDKRDDVDTRPLHAIIESKDPDKFTQTEAHLHLPFVRGLIEKNYQIAPYLNIISTVIAKEAKYKNTHYAFYHTTANVNRLRQDLYKLCYAHKYPGKGAEKFTFLRFNDEDAKKSAQSWLFDELKEKGLVDDNTAETGALLLSVNLALFGNVGFAGECSWDYFMHTKERKLPKREDYEAMMQKFGFTDKYVDEIMSLADIYETNEGTIVQILIPREKIDEIGYLAWVKGIPAHMDVIDLIVKTAKGKTFIKTEPVFEKLTRQFSKQGEKNPIYKDLLQSVKAGDFSLDSYLKIYRNKPWELANINEVTGRLLFTPDVLLNPQSGVKFYRYSTAHRDQLKEYRRRLDEVFAKIVADKEIRRASKPQQAETKPVVSPKPSPVPAVRPSIRPGTASAA